MFIRAVLMIMLIFDLDSEYARQGGKVAITATIPTQFGFVNVTTSESTAASIDAARNAYKAECENALGTLS